ncbi:acyl-CoA-binding protein [Deinococcus yavapaiensis]|nr:acyl-CoA-binding protein [Deinococcus yavapaiensis]
MQDVFERAAQDAQRLPKRPDNSTLLRLYALYKQGTEGNVTGERPGGFDFVGAAKYDAWAGLKGTAREDARGQYVALVAALKES